MDLTCLAIIDMQEEFHQSFIGDLIPNIWLQIDLAKTNGEKIFLIEYDGAGNTVLEISSLLSGYHNLSRRTKFNDSAGDLIFYELRKNKVRNAKIKICGVNTDACIICTVRDIQALASSKSVNYQVEVLADACSTYYGGHDKAIKQMSLLPGVSISP